jgi:hypothetical protein
VQLQPLRAMASVRGFEVVEEHFFWWCKQNVYAGREIKASGWKPSCSLLKLLQERSVLAGTWLPCTNTSARGYVQPSLAGRRGPDRGTPCARVPANIHKWDTSARAELTVRSRGVPCGTPQYSPGMKRNDSGHRRESTAVRCQEAP